jgi:hypothetical protein
MRLRAICPYGWAYWNYMSVHFIRFTLIVSSLRMIQQLTFASLLLLSVFFRDFSFCIRLYCALHIPYLKKLTCPQWLVLIVQSTESSMCSPYKTPAWHVPFIDFVNGKYATSDTRHHRNIIPTTRMDMRCAKQETTQHWMRVIDIRTAQVSTLGPQRVRTSDCMVCFNSVLTK